MSVAEWIAYAFCGIAVAGILVLALWAVAFHINTGIWPWQE